MGGERFVQSGRGHYEKHFCKIIVLEEMTLIYSSGCSYVRRRETICAILVEDIMRNISVKLLLRR